MRLRSRGMAAAAAAAALAIGAAGGVAASDRSVSPAPRDVSCTTRGDGDRLGGGAGSRFGEDAAARQGSQAGPATRSGCATGDATEPAALTADQRADIAEMAQEEKLAHDLYTAFAALYDDPRFDMIANAESQHLAAVRSLLTSYGIADPTAGVAEGEFTSDAWQGTYDQLLGQGSTSLGAALDAGALVERTDIADLESAMATLEAPDVERVYAHLLSGSQRHLQAFTR